MLTLEADTIVGVHPGIKSPIPERERRWALHNVRRHSQAREAVVSVEFGQETVRLSVRDDGRGLELPKTLGKFASRGNLGLIGMQGRARLLDASFSVESQAGKGTTVVVEVPG